MSAIEERKLQRKLDKLRKDPDNKICFDCTQMAPTYVCMDFATFICTKCSGIHREKNRVVKSVTMAKFSVDEVNGLSKGGNGKAKDFWLSSWTPEQYEKPSPNKDAAVRAFMRMKYEEKKWAKDRPAPMPQPEPTPAPAAPVAQPAAPVADAKADLLGLFQPAQPAAPAVQPQAAGDPFNDFFAQTQAQPAPVAAPKPDDPFAMFNAAAAAPTVQRVAPAPAPAPVPAQPAFDPFSTGPRQAAPASAPAPTRADPLADLFAVQPTKPTPAPQPAPVAQPVAQPVDQIDPFATFTQPAAPKPAPVQASHQPLDPFAQHNVAQTAPVHTQPAPAPAPMNPMDDLFAPNQPAQTHFSQPAPAPAPKSNPFGEEEDGTFTFDMDAPAPAANHAPAGPVSGVNPFDDINDAVSSMMFDSH